MIFGYDKNRKEISQYKNSTLKKHALLERKDLENWIANYPDILGEKLYIITTEYDKFDKTNERLDLLAIDKNGILTIIELKRDDSGKNVDLQAIKYAAYCSNLTLADIIDLNVAYKKSKGKETSQIETEETILNFIEYPDFEQLSDKPRIIIVAGEFRPEVTSSVLWLRKFDLDITCIRLVPYEISDNQIIFESNILIPLPETKDYVVRAERKDNTEKVMTRSQEEYLDFFRDIYEKFKSLTGVLPGKPFPHGYLQIPTGHSGVHFEWTFHGRPRTSLGVELHFESSYENNRKLITHFKKYKTEIDNSTGLNTIIQELWGSKWARIYVERNEGSLTDEQKDWAITTMSTFYKVLNPYIEEYFK